MEIKVHEKYCLKSDGMNLWIDETYTTKSGATHVRNVTGYHGTLEHCLNAFADRRIRASEADTATKLLKEMKSIKADIKSLCKALREKGAK